jgi:hypothetical protein
MGQWILMDTMWKRKFSLQNGLKKFAEAEQEMAAEDRERL